MNRLRIGGLTTSENPVGCYKRSFTIPEAWNDREVLVYFGGVASAFYLWINGTKIGYSQDSMSPAEYNITPHLQSGKNEIAVEVYSFSDGSYLEDQDFWRFSGIFREVFLYSVNNIHLEDISIQGILKENHAGILNIETEILNEKNNKKDDHPSELSIEVSLYELNKDHLLGSKTVDQPAEIQKMSLKCNDIVAWNPEQPFLYSVVVALKQGDKVLDIRHYRVGFTSIKIEQRKLIINESSIKLKGINRHEHSSTTGRVLTLAEMKRDMELIKKAHMNSVRTSHYPDHPLWYELCDQYGLMVMDETNLETHELSYHARVLPGDKEEWIGAAVARAESMTLRDRCHSSIIIWSLGNEAGYGKAFEKMAEKIRELDKRPIHYADMNLVADFDSQTYPPPLWLDEYAEGKALREGEQGQMSKPEQYGKSPSNKPFVMNEYAHAMGNSGGDFHLYWDKVYKHDCLIGGYIWEWCDHGLLQQKEGKKWYAYGGDFGDLPNDGNFCCDGLVGPDRQLHPHYFEIQHIQRPLALAFNSEKGSLYLENRHFFRDLKDFYISIIINHQSKNLHHYNFNKLACPSGDSVELKIDKAHINGGEIVVNMQVFYPDNLTPYSKDQLIINENKLYDKSNHYTCIPLKNPEYKFKKYELKEHEAKNGEGNNLVIKKDKEKTTITCNNKQWKFSMTTGYLCHFSNDKGTVFDSPMTYNFWRVPTDNDLGNKHDKRCAVWKNTARSLLAEEINITEASNSKVIISTSHKHPEMEVRIKSIYTFTAAGEVLINTSLDADSSLPEIPRLGFKVEITAPPTKIDFKGRGPHECYSDRKLSAFLDFYSLKPNELPTEYIRPQENGQRCDVRHLALKNKISETYMEVTSTQHFSFTLHPYGQSELEAAQHTTDISATDNYTLYLDYMQMGVGGDNSWGHRVHPEFCIPSGKYQWMFSLG